MGIVRWSTAPGMTAHGDFSLDEPPEGQMTLVEDGRDGFQVLPWVWVCRLWSVSSDLREGGKVGEVDCVSTGEGKASGIVGHTRPIERGRLPG